MIEDTGADSSTLADDTCLSECRVPRSDTVRNHVVQQIRDIVDTVPVDHHDAAICSVQIGMRQLWHRHKTVRSRYRLDWIESDTLILDCAPQIAYATTELHGFYTHFDGVCYVHEDQRLFGILQAIYQMTCARKRTKIVLVRRLLRCASPLDNSKFESDFGHQHMRFVLREPGLNDCVVYLISLSDIIAMELIVRDFHNVSHVTLSELL